MYEQGDQQAVKHTAQARYCTLLVVQAVGRRQRSTDMHFTAAHVLRLKPTQLSLPVLCADQPERRLQAQEMSYP